MEFVDETQFLTWPDVCYVLLYPKERTVALLFGTVVFTAEKSLSQSKPCHGKSVVLAQSKK